METYFNIAQIILSAALVIAIAATAVAFNLRASRALLQQELAEHRSRVDAGEDGLESRSGTMERSKSRSRA